VRGRPGRWSGATSAATGRRAAPAWSLGLLLFAVTACGAAGGHGPGEPPVQACGGGEELSEEAAARLFEEFDPAWLEAESREEGPVLEALARHFFALSERGALPGPRWSEGHGEVNGFKVSRRMGTDHVVAWLETAGNDMAAERACAALYQVQGEQAPDCRGFHYFFCRRGADFELLSVYRQAGRGWAKVK
jgi:hypothetical protein